MTPAPRGRASSPDHTRAADRRRDLELPAIKAQARALTPREESLLRKAARLRRQLERSPTGTPSAKTLERKRRVRR